MMEASKEEAESLSKVKSFLQVEATPFTKGEVQEPAYRDVWAAILFYGQVIAIAATAFILGPPMIRASEENALNNQGNDLNDNMEHGGASDGGNQAREYRSFRRHHRH